ncbi:hypothetical protein CLI92_09300 [Vandammella animalimorsus]|uniref:Bro-N domain-containing protein n=1 Tax=Vandammella animalimorsus TaxID=2029117 RepID=A0A2A2T4U9_9BURK|nr:BRO family protein [Vandammella animalimorsus]PAT30693.1 hypothetical protein CK626_14060 [Vandammella animalimorsus]PAX16515.1 hypothetical protein CLI92_09300 [Vandammella animalimorsus]PAX18930.1 hypothetical protein CLI93_11380 [Vandammella animalimorsus]
MTQSALAFQGTTFDIVDRNGQPWLRAHQIGVALDYKRSDIIAKLYRANAAEFTDSMTAVVKLPTAGGVQDVRIFSLRGAHLLGMFARTARAAEFRRWVLDVLDAQTQPTTITPAQQQHLKELVDLVVESGKQKSHAETWARLHRKFGVPRYIELPAAQFHSACLYLKSKIDQPSIATLIRKHLPAQIEALDLTGGPAAQAAHEAACQYIDNLRSGQQTRWDLPPEVLQGLVLDALMSQRFIVSFGYRQGMSINPIARDAYVLPSAQWASAIESGDAHLPPEELARLHAVVSAKISRSYLLMHSQRKAQPPALT